MPEGIDHKGRYALLACWITAYGLFLALSPKDWFGPSWSYFANHGQALMPSGGFGMGMCLIVIGILQLIQLARNTTHHLPVLFFCSGFVLWTSGIILGAEGLLGHRGIQEAPLMLVLGAHKFAIMGGLIANKRR